MKVMINHRMKVLCELLGAYIVQEIEQSSASPFAGVIVNVLLPTWLQTLALTVLLVFVIYKTANKGLKQWRSESKDAKMQEQTITHEDQLSPDSEGALFLIRA